MTELPEAYTVGVKTRFNWDSAYWLFNLVANWARLQYSHMIKEIKKVQHAWEVAEIQRLEGIDEEAYSLYMKDPDNATDFLNKYCRENANDLLKRLRELATHLIAWYSHNSWFGRQIAAPDSWVQAVKEKKE